MRCNQVQELFSEIYDNQAEGQALLIKHIENCPDCRAEYDFYCQLFDEVRALPEPELPENFHETAMENIRSLLPLDDNIIDDFIGEMETRDRLKDVRRASRSARAKVATRRWAGVAVAACLLLVSLWAVHTSNFGQRRDDEYFMPQAIWENLIDDAAAEPEMDPTVAAPFDMHFYEYSEEDPIDEEADYGFYSRNIMPDEDYIDIDAALMPQDWSDNEDVETIMDSQMEFDSPIAVEALFDDMEEDILQLPIGFSDDEDEAFLWGTETAARGGTHEAIGYGVGARHLNAEIEPINFEANENPDTWFVVLLVVVAGIFVFAVTMVFITRKKMTGVQK